MLPLNPARIPALYKQALAAQTRGRHDEARGLYRQIAAVRPKLAEVHYQLGRIALAEDDAAAASAHFDDAAALKPAEAAIWRAQAGAVARLDAPARRAFLDRAKAAPIARETLRELRDILAPAAPRPELGDAPPAEVRAAAELLRAGKPAAAERKARALRRAHPEAGAIADILAGAEAAQGRPAAAEKSHRAAVALAPDYAEGRANFGRFLVAQGRPEAAIPELRAALARAPRLPLALLALGAALTRTGAAGEAVAVLQRAVAERPKMAEAQARLGAARAAAGDHAQAAVALQAAVDLGDGSAVTQARLGAAHDAAGDSTAALAAYDAALAADPDRALTHAGRAYLLQRMGRLDEAEAGFRRAIARDPAAGTPYRMLTAARRLAADDPLIGAMERRVADPALGDEDRVQFGFALAKVMADTGAHGRVFTYLRPANEAMRRRQPVDLDARRREMEALRAAFADAAGRAVAGAPDYAPIFVTGMPRSGTTLVEAILAAHSRVTAAGEAGVFAGAGLAALADGGGGFRPVRAIPDAEISAVGAHYAEALAARFPGAATVTDKSIQTWLVLGLVRLALPCARIVVVRRDPRDTALSIYRNLFAEGTHAYAYDLAEIGRYLRLHERMIAFWRETIPGGFFEIAYEDLIAAPEERTRALLDAAGLDWEAACLDFHTTERRVETLSFSQVREPIHAGSVGGWRRYEAELGPLFGALAEED